jgi:hypothetical protein
MRKSIEIGALSFVMQVCSGISTTNSRRSTVCWVWIGGGNRNTRPGPAMVWKDPNRSTTSLWYSGTMCTIERMMKIAMTAMIPTVMS